MAYKIGSLLGAIVLLAGCSSGRPPTTPREEKAARAETAHATAELAEARCSREQRCGGIGDNKSYSSMDDCMSRVRADWKDDLNANECPAGVNSVRLNACLKSVQEEECGHPFETLDRIATCRTGAMCES
jgi:uncharacterized protein DUF6184